MTYLITGASRGIGFQTALALAAHPSTTVLVLSRQEEALQHLVQTAQSRYGHQNVHYTCYTLGEDTGALVQWLASFPPINGLVNNAGILINKPFQALSDADWQQLFEVNVLGVARLIRDVLPQLHRPAHIVNIGSMGGYQGSAKFPGLSAYSAAKGALAILSECLAEELKAEQIAVNCLALGAVQTEMLAAAFPGFQAPLDSEKMAEFMVWFLTQGHQFFNGKVLPVSVSTP